MPSTTRADNNEWPSSSNSEHCVQPIWQNNRNYHIHPYMVQQSKPVTRQFQPAANPPT